MKNLLSRIEKFYENNIDGIKPEGVDAYIYDPNDINRGRFTNKISRYNDDLIKNPMRVQPYQPDPQTISDISKGIQFAIIQDINYEIGLSKSICDDHECHILHSCPKDIILVAPTKINDLMYGDTLTPLGLLAIRMQRWYGNYEFKCWVEENYLKRWFFCLGHNIYINKNRPNLNVISEEFLDHIDNDNLPMSTDIFLWRD